MWRSWFGAVVVGAAARSVFGVLSWEEIHRRVLEKHGEDAERSQLVDVMLELDSSANTLTLEFEAFGHPHSVNLELDASLFHEDFSHEIVDITNGTSHHIEEDMNCLYRHIGTMLALASTCGNGFSATLDSIARSDQVRLELAQDSFVLVPSERIQIKCLAYDTGVDIDEHRTCGADAPEHGHVGGSSHSFNNEERTSGMDFINDVSYNQEQESNHVEQATLSRDLQGRRRKYIKVLIVNDQERYKQLGQNTHALSATILNHVRHVLLGSFNEMSEYFLDLQVVHMISFSRGDPWGNPPKNQKSEVNEKELLSAFSTWRSEQIAGNSGIPSHGVAHLFSGHSFEGSVVGLANVRTLCHDVAGTGVVQATGFTMETVATIMAHELMHNLGAFHATDFETGSLVPEPCGTGNRDFIMSPAGIKEKKWSKCTVNWVKMSFEGISYPRGCSSSSCTVQPTYGIFTQKCAETKAREWTLQSSCGNGIREPGEACDCGDDDCSETDPCCDGSTCTLKGDALCSSDDECCDKDTCSPYKKSQQVVCREPEPQNQGCDVAEMCDGESATCPFNEMASPGTSCGDNGACYSGRCQSHKDQCAQFGKFPCPTHDFDDEVDGCGVLYCRSSSDSATCEIQDRNVEDGTPCDGDSETRAGRRKVCRGERCIRSTLLDLPVHVTCSNGVLDPFETDVDCGGPSCLPCLPREKCLKDSDCFSTATNPGVCDKDLPPTASPTLGRNFQNDVGVNCKDYKEEDLCNNLNGCVWLKDYKKCKITDYFPPAGGCSIEDEKLTSDCCNTQKKEQSCINFIMCEWNGENDDEGTCDLIATQRPTPSLSKQFEDTYGTCREYEGEEGEDEGKFYIYDPLFAFLDGLKKYSPMFKYMALIFLTITVYVFIQVCRKEGKRFPQHSVIRPQGGSWPKPFRRGGRSSSTQSASTTASPSPTSVGSSSSTIAHSVQMDAQPFVLRTCPTCRIHYSNRSNPNGMCNACTAKSRRSSSLSNLVHPTVPASPSASPIQSQIRPRPINTRPTSGSVPAATMVSGAGLPKTPPMAIALDHFATVDHQQPLSTSSAAPVSTPPIAPFPASPTAPVPAPTVPPTNTQNLASVQNSANRSSLGFTTPVSTRTNIQPSAGNQASSTDANQTTQNDPPANMNQLGNA